MVVLCLAFPVARAAEGLSGTAQTRVLRAGEFIQTNLLPKVPGLAIAVAVQGTSVWSAAFGYAEIASKKPATTATRFRIGSVAKPLTASGLMLLVEDRKIDLDVPVRKYIPDLPEDKGALTLRLLAGHLTGIRNYRGLEALSDQPYPTLRAGLKIFENDPLIAPPGTKYGYSSYNWNMIGVAMEAAARTNFLAYMDARVFGPLGMTNTRPDIAGAKDPQRAQFYERDAAGNFIVAPPVDVSYKWPSGGYLSTADDLVRFGLAQLTPGFYTAGITNQLFASQKSAHGKETGNGVGWFCGRTILYHGGDATGGKAMLLLVPGSRTVVAIVVNRGNRVLDLLKGNEAISSKADLNLLATAEEVARIFSR